MTTQRKQTFKEWAPVVVSILVLVTNFIVVGVIWGRLDSDVEIEGDYLSKYALNHPEDEFKARAVLTCPYGITASLLVTHKDRIGGERYTVTDVRIRKEIPHGTVFVEATNLFDVDYEEIAGVPQPGVWLTGGVELRF